MGKASRRKADRRRQLELHHAGICTRCARRPVAAVTPKPLWCTRCAENALRNPNKSHACMSHDNLVALERELTRLVEGDHE